MKKILKIIASIIVVAPLSTSAVSCNENSNYDHFISWVNNKDTFVLYISASDSDNSKTFNKDIWTDLNKDRNHEFDSTREDSTWNTFKNNELADIDLHNFNDPEQSELQCETWFTDILKWCAQESYNVSAPGYPASKDIINSYTNAYKKTMPLFIYVNDGEYAGIKNNMDSDIHLDSNGGSEKIIRDKNNANWEAFFQESYNIETIKNYFGDDSPI